MNQAESIVVVVCVVFIAVQVALIQVYAYMIWKIVDGAK